MWVARRCMLPNCMTEDRRLHRTRLYIHYLRLTLSHITNVYLYNALQGPVLKTPGQAQPGIFWSEFCLLGVHH